MTPQHKPRPLTLHAIVDAMELALTEGGYITRVNVARRAKLSETTVYKYWADAIALLPQGSDMARLAAEVPTTPHQKKETATERVAAAMLAVRSSRREMTYGTVAQAAGLSITAVKNHWEAAASRLSPDPNYDVEMQRQRHKKVVDATTIKLFAEWRHVGADVWRDAGAQLEKIINAMARQG